MKPPFIIAIDGPAASGKGTLARRLAEHFGLPHLDTGLTYRAVAHYLLSNDLPLNDKAQALNAARAIDLGALDRDILAAHEIGAAASQIAVMTEVRKALVEQQRAFAKSGKGAVLDGRDIGTVVCPDAPVKLFVTASPQTRAQRRYDEIRAKGFDASFDDILRDIQIRDQRDSERDDSPLRPADDAHLLDTSKLDIDAAFQAALEIVEQSKSV